MVRNVKNFKTIRFIAVLLMSFALIVAAIGVFTMSNQSASPDIGKGKSAPEALNYVKNISNYETQKGLLVLFPGNGFDATPSLSKLKIPTPANGDMTNEYILSVLNNADAGIIGTNAHMYDIYGATLATQLNGTESEAMAYESPSWASGYIIPVNYWEINGINGNSVSATAYFDSTKVITANGWDPATECYFLPDGSTFASYTYDIPFVDPAPNSIATSQYQYTLTEGSSVNIGATVQPTNAYSKVLVYSSSNISVASVDNSGQITANKPGSATITITEKNFTNICTSISIQVNSNKIEATGISFVNGNYEVAKGKTQTITYTITPSNATETKITWTSSNPDVATVSNNGVITGKSAGTATITGTLPNGLCASCTVNVVVPLNNIVLPSSKNINQGETITLDVTYNPSDTTYRDITWTSSNNAIAKIDSYGNVTAVSPGSAVITASGANGIKSTCNITVLAIKAQNIYLNSNSIELNKNDSTTLSYTIFPEGVNSSVTWSTSNSNIAAVDNNGKVTAKGSGTTTITVKTDNGKTATCNVTVKNPVQSITITTKPATIVVGNTEQLKYMINPTDADNKNVSWSSDDSSIVSITSDGKIKGIKANCSTTIRATCENGVSDSFFITVSAAKPSSINLNETEKTVYVGDKFTLTATILPKEADDNITWSSDSSSVAIVNNGTVEAVGTGTATITAKTSNNIKATCKVTVKAFEATSVKINAPSTSVRIGEMITLSAEVLPEKANQSVTWTSSNVNIATVSRNGVIKGNSVGTVIITATTSNGKTATCSITVTPIEVNKITLDKTTSSIKVGGTTTLNVTYDPINATTKNVTWTSGNTNVATVSNGVVIAKNVGTTTITAKTSNGKTATCQVTVTPIEVASISLNVTSKELEQGKTLALYATVYPTNASVKTVTWASSNPSVATVDTNGKVTAKNAGTATITATSNNGKTATCNITVPEVSVTNISLSKTSANLDIGESVALTTTITPSNAGNKSVTWAVDDSSVATVDSNGNVKAVGEGKTIVTAKTANGKTAACTITVVDLSNYVFQFLPDNRHIQFVEVGETKQLNFAPIPDGINVMFKSEDESIVTVDSNGYITGKKLGSSSIIVTVNGKITIGSVQVTASKEMVYAARKQFAEEILYYVNIERKKEGLAPVQLMDDLSYLAQIRTDEQVKEFKANRDLYRTEPFISHTRPDGTPWSTVFEYASIPNVKAKAENLIQGAGYTAKTCVKRWMESPGHRANILRANLTHMGIGVEFVNIKPEGGSTSLCVTQLFIQQGSSK